MNKLFINDRRAIIIIFSNVVSYNKVGFYDATFPRLFLLKNKKPGVIKIVGRFVLC